MQKRVVEIYPGMVNFHIGIDETGKVEFLRIGNELPLKRNGFFGNEINKEIFKVALKYLLVIKPREFKELSEILKKNDLEMFDYVFEVTEEIRALCKN